MGVIRDGLLATDIAPVSMVAKAPASVTVTASSAEGIAANPIRAGLKVINVTGNTYAIAFGSHAAVLTKGIPITSFGVWNMSAAEFTTEAVNFIGDAEGNCQVQEWDRA